MDPDETLKSLLNDAREVLRCTADPEKGDTIDPDVITDLAEGVINLNRWIDHEGFLPKDWAIKCNGGMLHRALLADKVYFMLESSTESFEGELGLQLSYLLGAILNGATKVSLDLSRPEESKVYDLLDETFEEGHDVWKFVQTHEDTSHG